ncbi:MAG TPA: DegV family protein [Solirubrobacteraceae bacterium]|jgi:DegV family protein with EDD domain|nr:DegV family protein [Solirubrobacteraceae bacterium]
MPVAIVSDTCHYLRRDLVSDNGIRQVSLYVHRQGETLRESEIDDYDDYYTRLGRESELPTTSQPSIGDFLAVYEPLLDRGDDIVSIHLAGGMSGTVSTAEQAREQLGERAERVHVIDSRSACGGQGLVTLAAAAAARSGADASAVVDRTRQAREKLDLWFAIETLEYLRRGGRIGGAQAWLGSALQIKPILTVEGEITPVERVRTSRRAFERMAALLEECARHGNDAWMVQHIQSPEEARRLAERGKEIFGTDPINFSEIGPVIGTHVGPGLLGVGGIPSLLLQ